MLSGRLAEQALAASFLDLLWRSGSPIEPKEILQAAFLSDAAIRYRVQESDAEQCCEPITAAIEMVKNFLVPAMHSIFLQKQLWKLWLHQPQPKSLACWCRCQA